MDPERIQGGLRPVACWCDMADVYDILHWRPRHCPNQAIRIPVEFKLPGSEALISRDRDRLIIEPVRKRALAALLDTWEPLGPEFLDIDDPPALPKDIF